MAEQTSRIDKIAEWFKGKTGQEIRAQEHNGRLYWPETIKRLGPDGAVLEEACALRCPSVGEKMQSPILANLAVQKELAISGGVKNPPLPTREEAIAMVGFDRYNELETSCMMSLCVRKPEPPFAQMYLAQFITKEVPMASQYELYDRLDLYSRLEDVRVGDLSQDDFWVLVRRLAEVRNLTPLLVTGGSERDRFIVRMAEELSSLVTATSSTASSSTSTPASSEPTT